MRTDEPGAAADRVLPRQLPAAPAWLIGRDAESAALQDALAAAPVAVVEGPGGIGKSALALHWAHRNAARFPDGQLYADLGGFGRAGVVASPLSVLQGFLGALGVPQQAVPAAEAAAAALYRSVLAGRRLLIVLDNAAELAQVEQLLPGSPSCRVLVTSRTALPGLRRYGAVAVRLDVLPPDRSRELFARLAGPDVSAADPAAVNALAELCGGLPLALALLAARVAGEPEVPIALLAREMGDGGLAAFDAGDGSASLQAVLSWSYRALGEDEARAFRLLGAAPVDELGVAAAACVLDVPRETAAGLLRTLALKNLVTQFRPRRYRFHDLVRLYARKLAFEVGAIVEADDATARLADFYATAALEADRRLYPHRSPVDAGTPARLRFAGEDEALRWFAEEHRQLTIVQSVAAYQDRPRTAWLLCRALDTYQYRTGRVLDNLRTAELGARAARRLGTDTARMLSLRQLGRALTRAGEPARAAACLREALAAAGTDPGESAHTRHDLARVLGLLGDHRAALAAAEEAAGLYERAGNSVGRAHALASAARQCAELGDFERAARTARQALALHEEQRNPSGAAVTWDVLGFVALRTGDLGEAERCYGKALELSREQQNAFFEAEVTERLAQVHRAAGRAGQAAEALRACCRLYSGQHRLDDHERVRAELVAVVTRPETSLGR